MPFNRLNPMRPGKPPVPIHDKRNVLRNWPLAECPNEQFPEMRNDKLGRRRREKPPPESRQVHRSSHGFNSLFDFYRQSQIKSRRSVEVGRLKGQTDRFRRGDASSGERRRKSGAEKRSRKESQQESSSPHQTITGYAKKRDLQRFISFFYW